MTLLLLVFLSVLFLVERFQFFLSEPGFDFLLPVVFLFGFFVVDVYLLGLLLSNLLWFLILEPNLALLLVLFLRLLNLMSKCLLLQLFDGLFLLSLFL